MKQTVWICATHLLCHKIQYSFLCRKALYHEDFFCISDVQAGTPQPVNVQAQLPPPPVRISIFVTRFCWLIRGSQVIYSGVWQIRVRVICKVGLLHNEVIGANWKNSCQTDLFKGNWITHLLKFENRFTVNSTFFIHYCDWYLYFSMGRRPPQPTRITKPPLRHSVASRTRQIFVEPTLCNFSDWNVQYSYPSELFSVWNLR